MQLAIPVWEGFRPYDQMPAQFSCHVVSEHGQITHHAWLVDGPGDPRPEVAARLIDACGGVSVVLVYNASFDRTVLRLPHANRRARPCWTTARWTRWAWSAFWIGCANWPPNEPRDTQLSHILHMM